MDKQKKKKYSLGDIVWILLILSLIGSMVVNGGKMSLFGYRPIVVVTGSMEPAIAINSLSIVKYCDIEDAKVGDTVMYYHPKMGINITHRVIERKLVNDELQLITRGDANSGPDALPVTAEMFEGVLVKTFNGTVPIISLIIKNEQINKPALFILLILLTILVSSLISIIISILNFIVALIEVTCYSEDEFPKEVHKLNTALISSPEAYKFILSLRVKPGDTVSDKLDKIINMYYIHKASDNLKIIKK